MYGKPQINPTFIRNKLTKPMNGYVRDDDDHKFLLLWADYLRKRNGKWNEIILFIGRSEFETAIHSILIVELKLIFIHTFKILFILYIYHLSLSFHYVTLKHSQWDGWFTHTHTHFATTSKFKWHNKETLLCLLALVAPP